MQLITPPTKEQLRLAKSVIKYIELTNRLKTMSIEEDKDYHLSGCLTMDTDNGYFYVNIMQLKDYCDSQEADDLYNVIMNMFTDAAKEANCEVVIIDKY